jgi:ABC-type uncharacterized transport system YnjBCD substrate-binding protein
VPNPEGRELSGWPRENERMRENDFFSKPHLGSASHFGTSQTAWQ